MGGELGVLLSKLALMADLVVAQARGAATLQFLAGQEFILVVHI